MSQDIETMFENNLQESGNVVTKGAKPAERSELKNDAEEIGGPDNKTYKPDDTESLGKKIAAKVKKAAAPSTKPSGASGDKQDSLKKSPTFEETQEDGEVIEEETEETIQYSFDEDLDALVSGSDLTEEFRDKAKLIFEAAVNAKINEEVANLNEAYEAAFEEAVTEFKTEMSEQIDSYLTFVAEKWVAENALAIDSGIKTEIAENIMLGLKNLFQENHLDVPEEEFDVVAEMTEQLDVIESKLNEQIDLNVEMHKKLGNYIKNGIVSEVSVGLAETQKDKLQGLSEGVEFINESDFREKIETLKESYFTRAAAPAVEDAPVEQPVSGDAMSLYSQAISRWSTRQA